MQVIIHDMVGRERLPSAIRLSASARYLAILLGPAIGGGLMLLLTPAWGILANVLLYLPFTLFLFRAPYTGHAHRVGEPARPRFGLAEGWRLFRELTDQRLVTMIVLGGATSVFVGNAFQAQMPEYAHDLGADETGAWYSVLLAANAAGAIIGTVALETLNVVRPTTRGALVCAALWGVTIGLFPLATSYRLAV